MLYNTQIKSFVTIYQPQLKTEKYLKPSNFILLHLKI